MTEKIDVLVVGAGISGIGAGYHLQSKCPDANFIILEGRDKIGGTWDLFKYPGIRSDSDMYTLGFNFKPWKEQEAIADAPSILKYLNETVEEFNLKDKIRFGKYVKKANWSSSSNSWTVDVEDKRTGDLSQISCSFIFMCSGYYSYKEGYTPEFEGIEDFAGDIIHPQKWDENFDYSGKKIVVVGSGATAVTIVPEMAKKAEHVTMLQRSPTYVVAAPEKDKLAIDTVSTEEGMRAAKEMGAANGCHSKVSTRIGPSLGTFPMKIDEIGFVGKLPIRGTSQDPSRPSSGRK